MDCCGYISVTSLLNAFPFLDMLSLIDCTTMNVRFAYYFAYFLMFLIPTSCPATDGYLFFEFRFDEY